MGIYLNPDNEGFREAVHSKIYVDKTGLIANTNALLSTQQKYICVKAVWKINGAENAGGILQLRL